MDRPALVGDPRFFQRSGPHSLAVVAAAVGAEAPSQSLILHGVAPLQTATPAEVSFLDNRKYLEALAATKAGAVIVHPDMASRVPAGSVALVTPTPYVGWARTAALFHPLPPVTSGIHPSAVIAPGASVDPTAEIGPLVVIGAGAVIGPRCRIGPLCVIGDGVVLGEDCRIGARAGLSHTLAGNRVTVFPGASIGQDGFGFAVSADGFVSVPQLGRVILEDDVEIGANTTIDRGSSQDTVIGAGSRLDNLVQIGHNVQMGRACVIVGQAGISGSTILDDHVMMGGQSGMTGHLHIGKGARIAAQAGVVGDIPAGAEFVGSPAQLARTFFREYTALRRLVRAAVHRGGSSSNSTESTG